MSAISELSTVHRTKAQTPEEKRLRAKEASLSEIRRALSGMGFVEGRDYVCAA